VPTETTPRPLPVSPAEAKNPYRVEPPCLISFSGGRTSGYMLWHILEAHGGALPEGVHVTFANTGKERPETLAFVHEVETRWPVRDLQLEQHEGNCDLCFLKSTAKIERILRDHPESADWWVGQERATNSTFRIDRPRYANLLKIIQEQPTLPFGGDHEYDVCNCTD
jgi:3'-phosphoadenosine 5'-phosphosulfate sulfotransferase (PAPS reductase)/FAD synthetase